ncbi:MAG: ABC transporter substrate-binding protein [Puniceicoccaceae bacterium]
MIQRIFFLLVALFALLTFAGCGKSDSDSGSSTETPTIFKYSTEGAPISMDPVRAATKYANLMVTSIYDTLYEYKYLAPPYELKPRLAAAMPEISDDGLVYTIALKEGVLFADNACFPDGKGREVVAADFVYSFKRMFDPDTLPQGAWLWQGRVKGAMEWRESGTDYSQPLSGVTAVDDYTIRIELTQPYPQLMYTLAMGFSSIVPREAVEHYGKEFGINPVGSGPYMMKDFTTKLAKLVANPNYRDEVFKLAEHGYRPEEHAFTGVERIEGAKLPIMKEVEIHFMAEPVTRWTSFLKGSEVQYATMPLEQRHAVTESVNPLVPKPRYREKYNSMLIPDFGLVMVYINMDDPRIGMHEDPDQNRRNQLLRRAIRKGYDWEDRNNRFLMSAGSYFPGIIIPSLEAFDENLSRDTVTANFEAAKELLKEGGWTAENLPPLEYGAVTSVRSKQYFEQFRGWMEKIGYPTEKVVYRPFPNFGDYSKAVKNKEVMIMPMGWGLDYPDAENLLQLLYGPNESPGSNAANYKNPEYDELFRKAKEMLPGPERTAIYRQLNEMIVEDVPVIVGLMRRRANFWHRNVIMYPSENVHGSVLKYVKVVPESESVQPPQ